MAPEALLEQLVSAAGDVGLEVALRGGDVEALGAVPALGGLGNLEGKTKSYRASHNEWQCATVPHQASFYLENGCSLSFVVAGSEKSSSTQIFCI